MSLEEYAERLRQEKREMDLVGFSEETRALIRNMIALSPALEESIMALADLAYRDGADNE